MKKKFKFYRGLTLIETMMAIAIFVIGIEGFVLLFSHTWKNNAYTLEMGQSAMAVSRGVGEIANYLRSARQSDNGAFPVVFADDNNLTVYCDYDKNGETERLHFYFEDGKIKMGITSPVGTMPKSYPSEDDEVVVLAERIVNTSSEPIFYFYGADFYGRPEDQPLDSPAQVSRIRMVKIRLKINIDPNRAPDNIEMETLVSLRNLGDYNRIAN